jgi:hypothetical protein
MKRAHLWSLVSVWLFAGSALAQDEFTRYELLAPDSHRFAIAYDVTAEKEGDRFFLNPIREGSIASDERVVDQATGKPLKWEIVTGKQAREAGLTRETVKDQAQFLKVELAGPVPRDGQRRIRIFKTYTDPKSYYADGDQIVFDRGLGIRRNAVVLPAGYELVGSTVPAIVSTEADGRIKASFVNDRDDTLPVKVAGRRLAAAVGGTKRSAPRAQPSTNTMASASADTPFHRAEQDRVITYWLLAPESGQFRISHDFTVTRSGQRSVHSFVRKGSTVSRAVVVDLDTGATLKTYNVTGKEVNALGYYPEPTPDDSVVVQADLPHPLAEGETTRVRVIETYTDADRYFVSDGELVWDRTLGRPWNLVVLPAGWMLASVSVPAVISLDQEGRVWCRFVNPRNDEVHVVLRARRRP